MVTLLFARGKVVVASLRRRVSGAVLGRSPVGDESAVSRLCRRMGTAWRFVLGCCGFIVLRGKEVRFLDGWRFPPASFVIHVFNIPLKGYTCLTVALERGCGRLLFGSASLESFLSNVVVFPHDS